MKDGLYTLDNDQGFGGSRQGRSELDAAASPRRITIRPSAGPHQGQSLQGIYRRDGTRLESCFDPTGAGRPESFAADAGTGFVHVTYERKP